MSSVANKRTSKEYAFRQSVNPGQSYADFIRQIPDQAMADQAPRKHSETKKPYNASGYEDMEYSEMSGIPPWSLPDYPVAPHDTSVPNFTKPGDENQVFTYPVRIPYYPVPRVTTPPTVEPPIPGDEPGNSRERWQYMKCCTAVYLSCKETARVDEDIRVFYGGGDPSCHYDLKADQSEWIAGSQGERNSFGIHFQGGEYGEATLDGLPKEGTIIINIKPSDNVFTDDPKDKPCKEKKVIVGDVGCGEGVYISYTSQGMNTGESQGLGIGGLPTKDGVPYIPKGTTYEWVLTAGGGSLYPHKGISTVYTAPATNAECVDNPTITLYANGKVCDTLKLAVNGATTSPGTYISVFKLNLSDCVTWCQTSQEGGIDYCSSFAGYKVEHYGCDSLPSSADTWWDTYSQGTVLGSCEETPVCGQGPAAWCDENQGVEYIDDQRPAWVKTLGCCPSQVL